MKPFRLILFFFAGIVSIFVIYLLIKSIPFKPSNSNTGTVEWIETKQFPIITSYPKGWHVAFTGNSRSQKEGDTTTESTVLLNPTPLNLSDYGGPHAKIYVKKIFNITNAYTKIDEILKTDKEVSDNYSSEILNINGKTVHHTQTSVSGIKTDSYLFVYENDPAMHPTENTAIEATLYNSDDTETLKIFKELVNRLVLQQ